MELETLHLTTLALTATVILYSDHQGFMYFRGKRETLSLSFVTWSHRIVWTGLIGMILTGFFLVLPGWDYYVVYPPFLLKIAFVLVLCIDGYAIGKFSRLTTERAFHELPPELKKTLLVSGAFSFTGWVGSAVIGFFFL
jgi:hypothetical protein